MKIKYRLIKDGKIVGFELHEKADPFGIRIYHRKPNECSGWDIREWQSRYLEHDEKNAFTNLLDKNGVEIYEGDILARERYAQEVRRSGWDFVFVVDYNNGQGSFMGYTIPGRNHYLTLERAMNMDGAEYVEVIGNKFEHPHLLKGEA